MKEQLSALYEVQSLDIKIAEVQSHLLALDGAKELKRKLGGARAALEADNKTLRDWELQLKGSELELKTIEEKRKKCEKRLYGGTITNAKELSATEKEIETLKAGQANLDERILGLFDVIEEKKTRIASVLDIEKKIEKKIGEVLVKEAADRAACEKELAELQSQRSEAVALVTEKPLLARYDLIRKKTGSTAIAKVVDNKCGGCHVGVMLYTTRKIFENKELVSCENCGRILTMDVR